MSCKIPYIEQRFRDVNPSLADTLNTKYSQIWDSVIESELFKKEEDTGKYLMATTNISRLQEQQDFIDKVNQDNSVPEGASVIENLNGYVNVNVLNLVEAGKEPSKDNALFQLDSPNQEAAIEELDNYLLKFLESFNVQSYQVEELKSKFNLDALGVADVLNKTIWYTQNRNVETVPEEVGHMVTMLMGINHPDLKELTQTIELWSEYEEIKKRYLPIYNNIEQVKSEAIGKLIAKALVKNYKASGLDNNLLQKVLDNIRDFIRKLFTTSKYNMYLADKVAINILAGNTDYIANIQPKFTPLDYNKALENNKLASEIIQNFGVNLNNPLVGSLAIAGQGEVIYRPSEDPIHDLDFVVDGTNTELKQKLGNLLLQKNAVPVHYGWSHKNYTTFAYLIPRDGLTVTDVKRTRSRWIQNEDGFKLKDADGNYVEVNPQNVIAVDFFIYDVKPSENVIGDFASIQDIYKGKLGLGKKGDNSRFFERTKDQEDYVLSNFANRDIQLPQFIYYQIPESDIDYTSLDVTASLDAETKAKIDYLRNNDDLTVQC